MEEIERLEKFKLKRDIKIVTDPVLRAKMQTKVDQLTDLWNKFYNRIHKLHEARVCKVYTPTAKHIELLDCLMKIEVEKRKLTRRLGTFINDPCRKETCRHNCDLMMMNECDRYLVNCERYSSSRNKTK